MVLYLDNLIWKKTTYKLCKENCANGEKETRILGEI